MCKYFFLIFYLIYIYILLMLEEEYNHFTINEIIKDKNE